MLKSGKAGEIQDAFSDGHTGTPPPPTPEISDLGDETLDASVLACRPAWLVARHLMVLLAKRRGRGERAQILSEISDLVEALGEPRFAKKVLFGMAEAGRIVDIYPLELLEEVVRRRPGWLPEVELAPFIENRAALESSVFGTEEPIEILMPIGVRVRAFALAGGGSPGYCLAPGARPGSYQLEIAEAGAYRILLRGEHRGRHLIDGLTLSLEDREPGSP